MHTTRIIKVDGEGLGKISGLIAGKRAPSIQCLKHSARGWQKARGVGSRVETASFRLPLRLPTGTAEGTGHARLKQCNQLQCSRADLDIPDLAMHHRLDHI